MAIRDRFKRALHKSDSGSSISQTESNTTVATATTNTSSETSSQPSSLRKQPTQQPKFAFPWSKSDQEKEQRKEEKERKKNKKSGKPLHPRDKPLTATNLRHQEMLGEFTWTFGSSPNRMSQLVPPDAIGVSPCCTRSASLDLDNGAELFPGQSREPEPGTSTAEPPKTAAVHE